MNLHHKWYSFLIYIQLKGRTQCRELPLCAGSGRVSGKTYPRLCNARRPQLKSGTFRSQAVRLYRLHQAHPSQWSKDDSPKLLFEKTKAINFREEGSSYRSY